MQCAPSCAMNSCCAMSGHVTWRRALPSCLPCTSCRNATSAPSSRRRSRMSCSTSRRLNCESPLWMLYVTTLRDFAAMSALSFGKHQDRLAIAPREHLVGGLLPRQPRGRQVLARLDADLDGCGHLEPEHVLGVVRDIRRVTAAPYGIDFEDVLQVPLLQPVARRVDACLLGHFADRGGAQALAFVLAARDGLPVARTVRALEQQHLEVRRVDHDKRRDRDLVRARRFGASHARMRATTSPMAVKNACGMSRVRCCAAALPASSTATMPTSASKSRPSLSSTSFIALASVAPRSTASEMARPASERITYSPVPVAEAAIRLEA